MWFFHKRYYCLPLKTIIFFRLYIIIYNLFAKNLYIIYFSVL